MNKNKCYNAYRTLNCADAVCTIVERIKDTLIELGKGFSFVGNQYKITVDNTDYFIDMLFYYLKLRCYVVIESSSMKTEQEMKSLAPTLGSAFKDDYEEESINDGYPILSWQ